MFPDLAAMPDEKLQEYNAVVYQREIDTDGGSPKIIERFQNLGLKVIFDIDDYWHLPDTHHLYRVYKNKDIPKQTEEILGLVDMVTTTTERLAGKIAAFTDRVKVFPNCLDLNSQQWQSNKVQSDLVRFGYVAGVYHLNDVRILERPIQKAISNVGECGFVLGGYSDNIHYRYYEMVLSGYGSAKSRYGRLAALPVEQYGLNYNHIDVSLVPLAQSNFSACKSEIKLLEAAAHGNAVIASNVPPYNTFPKDCAIFVENPNHNDWFKAIRDLTRDEAIRNKLANNLSEYVKENYDLNKWTEQRKEALRQLLA